MHIKKIEITNIRNIEKLVWELPDGHELAGWHVLIGDNGSGKTTVLRAIALGLIGGEKNFGLNQDWNSWLRRGEQSGEINLLTTHDPHYDPETKVEFRTLDERDIYLYDEGFFNHEVNVDSYSFSPNLSDLAKVREGWFSCAFGTFRRLSGGHPDTTRVFLDKSSSRLAAHLSIFGEEVALSEVLVWLRDLRFKKYEGEPEGELLDKLKQFINHDGFLPFGVRLDVINSSGVFFLDGNGQQVTIQNLSDGYRSFLAMTLEIIRQMSIFYPNKPLFNDDFTQVIPPGVVLIDEVDAHLHPSWQREIGRKLTALFPNIQFIVTTHSPLVCQASVKGSIFRLPTPGTAETGGMIERGSENWKRLVYGDILEAYSTDLFGENIERSEVAQEKLDRVAELLGLQYDRPLTDDERDELNRLMNELPDTPDKYRIPNPLSAEHDTIAK